jgi:hypothetical protein
MKLLFQKAIMLTFPNEIDLTIAAQASKRRIPQFALLKKCI